MNKFLSWKLEKYVLYSLTLKKCLSIINVLFTATCSASFNDEPSSFWNSNLNNTKWYTTVDFNRVTIYWNNKGQSNWILLIRFYKAKMIFNVRRIFNIILFLTLSILKCSWRISTLRFDESELKSVNARFFESLWRTKLRIGPVLSACWELESGR